MAAGLCREWVLQERARPLAHTVSALPASLLERFSGPDLCSQLFGVLRFLRELKPPDLAPHVTFSWKDYRNEARVAHMRLAPAEFIRRFLLHVLPDGFQRIRHYGFLANGHRQAKLARIRQLLPAKPSQQTSVAKDSGDATIIKQEVTQTVPANDEDVWEPLCPQCGGGMEIVERVPAPPHRPRTAPIDTS